MKLGRGIGIAIGIVAVVVIAAVIYVWSSLDSIVAAAIEKYGSQATQTSVSVSGVKLELTQGRAAISGLTVANPSGFSTPTVFSLGGILSDRCRVDGRADSAQGENGWSRESGGVGDRQSRDCRSPLGQLESDAADAYRGLRGL